MAKLKVLKAVAVRTNPKTGRMIRSNRRKNGARRRSNVAAGFRDDEGIFHPIRASFDYDSKRAGDPPRKGKRKAGATKKKSAPKKKSAAKKKGARRK